MSKYYAVAAGRLPGVYKTWNECSEQVNKFSGAKYMKFNTYNEAITFINDNTKLTDKYLSNLHVQNNNIKEDYYVKSNNKKYTEEYDDMILIVDSRTVIWTDGSCINNGNNDVGGYGVFFGKDNINNNATKIVGNATNNRMELMAIIKAMQISLNNNYHQIEIRTDSQYATNGIQKYMNSWKQRNFKNVKNKDLWLDIIKLQDQLDIKWTHVRSHRGLYGNEMADQLAKKHINL